MILIKCKTPRVPGRDLQMCSKGSFKDFEKRIYVGNESSCLVNCIFFSKSACMQGNTCG